MEVGRSIPEGNESSGSVLIEVVWLVSYREENPDYSEGARDVALVWKGLRVGTVVSDC